MNWYLQRGKESDVVISSRIRLARNLKEFRFTNRYNRQEAEAIEELIKENVPSIGYGLKFLRLKDIDDLNKMALIEKHLISPEFAFRKDNLGAILVNEEENICIMINEEDHLRIQIFSPGLDIENSMKFAIEIDERIGSILNYAVSEKYGFLTSCPTNAGTALRASIMVHLPALKATGNINKILEAINNFGMNIRGIYGEGSEISGDMYQISNKQTLGISEEEIIRNIKLVTEKIIEQERLARKYLAKNSIELEDRVYRSFGILTNCKKITSKESQKLLSDVKLGTDLGIIKELDDLKVAKLTLYTKPANLQLYLGKNIDTYDRDIERANIIKQLLMTDTN